ncbi:MAG: hypothetical protein AB3N20_05720 [Rhizobiaceae bacterium]
MQAVSRYLQVMRSFFAFLAILLIAGCNSPTNSYLLNGIGAELPARDVANSTGLQQKYFNYLCKQAGLPYSAGANGAPSCSLPLHDRGTWTLLVYQGMNDIDRRCDAYLQWLDNKKRSKEPLLSQIGTTKTVVQEVIEITVPNAASAVKAISVVGMAFQLLSDSIENYHSRLLLEINSSTINSIVLQGRYDFRKHLRDKRISFQNRPEAEHALRSYLRLCLPFAIEAKINNFSTLGASGGTPDEGNTLGDLPVVGSTPLRPDQEFGEPRPTPPPGPKPGKDFDKVFANPKKYGRPDLILLQNGLCLQGQGIGSIGPKTAAAIRIFEDTKLSSVDFGDLRQPNKNGLIDDFEFKFITNFKSCDAIQYKNMFERINYEVVSAGKAAANRAGLISLLNARLKTSFGTDASFSDPLLREAIKRAQAAYGTNDYGGFAANHLTQELRNRLGAGPPPNG